MPGVAIFPADPGRGTCPRARGEAGAATTRDRRQPGRPLADPPARALQSPQPAPPCPPATAASPCLGLAASRLASRKQRLPPGPETPPPPGLRREAETGRAAAAGGGARDAGAAERRYQDARARGSASAREGGHVISPQPSSAPQLPAPQPSDLRLPSPQPSSAPQPSTPQPSNLQLLSPQPNSDPKPSSPQLRVPATRKSATPQSAALHPSALQPPALVLRTACSITGLQPLHKRPCSIEASRSHSHRALQPHRPGVPTASHSIGSLFTTQTHSCQLPNPQPTHSRQYALFGYCPVPEWKI